MQFELMETNYNTRKRTLNLKVKIMHDTYGAVLGFFALNRKKAESLTLLKAFVEDMVIPLHEHQNLIVELKNNLELLDDIRKIGFELVKNEATVLVEEKLEQMGTLSELTLDYVVILSASSMYSNEIKRKGAKLSDITESKLEKHILFIIVKFKELEDEYELKVSFDTKKGYRITSTTNNKDKPYIKNYLDDKTTRGIIMILKKKVDFLP